MLYIEAFYPISNKSSIRCCYNKFHHVCSSSMVWFICKINFDFKSLWNIYKFATWVSLHIVLWAEDCCLGYFFVLIMFTPFLCVHRVSIVKSGHIVEHGTFWHLLTLGISLYQYSFKCVHHPLFTQCVACLFHLKCVLHREIVSEVASKINCTFCYGLCWPKGLVGASGHKRLKLHLSLKLGLQWASAFKNRVIKLMFSLLTNMVCFWICNCHVHL